MSFGHHHATKKSHKHTRSQSPFLSLVDRSIYLVAILAVAANVPQLLNIWVTRNLNGVSLVSWVGFLIGSFFWLWYGVLHKERPIIFINSLLILVQGGIVLGLLVK